MVDQSELTTLREAFIRSTHSITTRAMTNVRAYVSALEIEYQAQTRENATLKAKLARTAHPDIGGRNGNE